MVWIAAVYSIQWGYANRCQLKACPEALPEMLIQLVLQSYRNKKKTSTSSAAEAQIPKPSIQQAVEVGTQL